MFTKLRYKWLTKNKKTEPSYFSNFPSDLCVLHAVERSYLKTPQLENAPNLISLLCTDSPQCVHLLASRVIESNLLFPVTNIRFMMKIKEADSLLIRK